MQVILLQRIGRLGQMGDIVNVKNGYARNFLLPQKKALRATDENKKVFEGRRAQLEADNLSHKKEAEAVAAKLDGKSFVIIRAAGDTGQLYGSVSTRDIAARDQRRRLHRRSQPDRARQADQVARTDAGPGAASPRGREHGVAQHRSLSGRGRQAVPRRECRGRQGRSSRTRDVRSGRGVRGRPCRDPRRKNSN